MTIKQMLTAIFEEHICITADDVGEFLSALEARGYAIVPIVPSEQMLEELAHIGDGPMISGAEVWGYMLAAVPAGQSSAPTEKQ